MIRNKVILIGRITADPVSRVAQTSMTKYVPFTIAYNRPRAKEEEKKTDFINCICWENQAEFLEKYVLKGDLIGIEGRIRNSSYVSAKGEKLTRTDILVDSIDKLEYDRAKKSLPDEGDVAQESELPF